MTDTDWAAWSRDAVALMKARNADWPVRYGLAGASYRWDLESGTIRFTSGAGDVVASLCLVGTLCDTQGTFVWSWADDHVTPSARRGIDRVRSFGEQHDLGLLIEGQVGGGHAQGMELLAIAGRILDAEGVLMDRAEDMTLYFTLADFRAERGA